jgi:hypothetical protein
VLPSIPGYGFSAEPAEIGWYSGRVAQAWAELMRRLGYTRYVAQGASVTDAMGRQAPGGLIGIHTNLLVPALGGGTMPTETEEERAAADQLATFRQAATSLPGKSPGCSRPRSGRPSGHCAKGDPHELRNRDLTLPLGPGRA